METEGVTQVRVPHLVFDVVVVLITFSAAIYAAGISKLGRGFPLFVSSVAAVFAVLVLSVHLWKYRKSRRAKESQAKGEQEVLGVEEEDVERRTGAREAQEQPSIARVIGVLAWFVGYAVVIWLVGLIPATIIYLSAFLLIETRMRVIAALAAAFAVAIGLSFLMNVLGISDPPTVFGFWNDVAGSVL